jgi:G:T-mismatch repair DNA endonuclease (very short patch repair protein)
MRIHLERTSFYFKRNAKNKEAEMRNNAALNHFGWQSVRRWEKSRPQADAAAATTD